MILGDLKGEDEKLAYALELAFTEISKDKELNDAASGADTNINRKTQKKYLGTHNMIKLPYVIGTQEFIKHKYAGIVYMNLGDDLEQVDIHNEEQKQLMEDQARELEILEKNAADIANLEKQYEDAEIARIEANIPKPPPAMGSIPPPPGMPAPHVPPPPPGFG